ncbi:MAG: DUF1080 domain-containing protein [Planctomycetaceae bacterium]|jgi:type 1 glutamine amidotransferase|nr:DUF1080 domain-containing protein [Phycisphaerales bacterium]MCE2652209.1 DUF1080 domain-containing protein [Planctomycetaceae bacterium]
MLTPALLAAAACLAQAPDQSAAAPIRALLLTGVNNHNWRFTSRMHADTLEATGKFDVTISDDPASALASPDLAKAGYTLFVLDYNDLDAPKRWGPAAEAAFVSAVNAGAGVVAIHSANNAFKGWTEYEQMLGLLWRQGAGHGAFHAFEVVLQNTEHPVTKGNLGGLGRSFRTRDELYHGLTPVPSSRPTMLADAMSSRDSGGTGSAQPMALVNQFGQGRIFATPLGHVWTNVSETKQSISGPGAVGFKTLLVRGAEWAATGRVTLTGPWSDVRTHNRLTPEQAKEGWTLLFDGSTPAFRGFKKQAMPDKGWVVRDGLLVHTAGGGGGDIVTLEQYGDFEFSVEWRAAAGANSGIIYRASEAFDYPWMTGPEMQILDDDGHRDGKGPKTRAGTLYDLFPCTHDVVRPAGEWNHARVVTRGSRIEHWLNGVKVVDIDMDSEEYKKAHAASKWPGMKAFGTTRSGHIALQDHGDEVAFRNIMVRRIDGK